MVTIVGNHFETMPNMKCAWSRAGGPTLYTTATRPVGPSDIVCSTPNSGTEPAPVEYSVYVAAGSPIRRQTDSLSFLFYGMFQLISIFSG